MNGCIFFTPLDLLYYFYSCIYPDSTTFTLNSRLVIETSQEISDVPYGDYFRVEVQARPELPWNALTCQVLFCTPFPSLPLLGINYPAIRLWVRIFRNRGKLYFSPSSWELNTKAWCCVHIFCWCMFVQYILETNLSIAFQEV